MLENLTITQKKALKVLGDHEDEWLKQVDISKLGKINIRQTEQALKRFYDNDYIFYNGIDDEFQISPDGKDLYYNFNLDKISSL